MKVEILNNIDDFGDKFSENPNRYFLIAKNFTIGDIFKEYPLKAKESVPLKIAYNKEINGYILNEDTTKKDVHNLKEVIEYLDENYQNKKLILNINTKTDDGKNTILDIMQQFVFLQIDDFEVLSQDDLKNQKMYEKFNEIKAEMKAELNRFKSEVLSYDTNDKEIKESKKTLTSKIDNLLNIIKETKQRKLIISAIALRNAGKSVVVNNFLGQELAPTSDEDSTPCSVIYETWDKDYIEVKIPKDEKLDRYKNETIKKFKNAEEVYKYLSLEFDFVNDKMNEKYMPDIYIKYPGDNDYIFVDTPGPNKNDEHANISDYWLEKSDVVLFVREYGDNEEKNAVDFLKKVRSVLLKKDKIHSLLVIENKLDQMYNNKHQKSKTRYLDKSVNYLKDIENISTLCMATSALEYFDVLEIKNLMKKYNYDNLDDFIEESYDLDLNDDENSIIGMIENSIKNLKRFYGLRNVTIEDIVKHSNFEAIINKTRYVAENRAFIEVFSNLFYRLENELNSIKNQFVLGQLDKLVSKKDEIEKKLDEISQFFQQKKEEAKNMETKFDIDEPIDTMYNEISKETISSLENELESFKNDVIEKKTNSIKVKDIMEKLTSKIEKKIDSTIVEINKAKNEELEKIEYTIYELDYEIQDYINSKNLEEYGIEFEWNELNPSLRKDEFHIQYKFGKKVDIYANFESSVKDVFTTEIRTKTKTYKESDSKWWNPFSWRKTVTKKRIIEYEVEVVDEENLDKEIKQIKESFVHLLSKELEDDKKETKRDLENQFKEFDKKLKIEKVFVIENYEELNNQIKNGLNKDIDTLNNQAKFYNESKKEFEKLETLFKEVVK